MHVMLFQEQILRLAVHYAGMDWEEMDQFRRLSALSRSKASWQR